VVAQEDGSISGHDAKLGMLVHLTLKVGNVVTKVRLAPRDLVESCRTRVTKISWERQDSLVSLHWNIAATGLSGGSLYFNPWAKIICQDCSVRAEPLSGNILFTDQNLPGNAESFPPGLNENAAKSLKIIRLNFYGDDCREHITGAKLKCREESDSNILLWILVHTGQQFSFWFELIHLVFALYYLDVILDGNQLCVFYKAGLFIYLLTNLVGMLIPVCTTWYDMISWLRGHSPGPERAWL
jgi:hypothetical protein